MFEKLSRLHGVDIDKVVLDRDPKELKKLERSLSRQTLKVRTEVIESKAWRVITGYREHEQLIYASSREDAIRQSKAFKEKFKYLIEAERVSYADGLEDNPHELYKTLLQNGWILDCRGCGSEVGGKISDHVTVEGKPFCRTAYVTSEGDVLCGDCFEDEEYST